MKNYSDGFGINNLLYLYEKAEIKYFDYISEEISKNNNIIQENIKDIEDFFKEKNDQLFIKEITLLDIIKKYIMRYCLGDNQNKNEIIKNIDMTKIIEEKSVWIFIDINDEKEEMVKNEKNKLLELNEENNLMKYVFKKLFGSKKSEQKKKRDIPLDDDEEEQLARRRKRNRRRMDI